LAFVAAAVTSAIIANNALDAYDQNTSVFDQGISGKGVQAAAKSVATDTAITAGAAVSAGGLGVVGSKILGNAKNVGAQIFPNLAPREAIGYANTFSSSAIYKVQYSGRLNYVVKENGQLVIGRTGHTSLSKGGNVLAADEARFVKGELRSINNASGHYKPSGSSAKNEAEAAFQKAGFNAIGKYTEKKF
jgi:hypothetical protein